MVIKDKSAVTPERFAAGKTYEQYRASMPANLEKYDANYAVTHINEEDVRDFKALIAQPDGPAKVLVITEDWCPDCYREVPVMVRIAEASGMELRVLERDQHKDVMEEFKKNGEFDSIPVFVFYTRDHQYLGHFIERSKYAEAHIPDQRAASEGLSREERAVVTAQYQKDHWGEWRQATVTELKEMFTKR